MRRHSKISTAGMILLLTGAVALAQDPQPAPTPVPGGGGPPAFAPGPRHTGWPPQPGRPPMAHAGGRWWDNPQLSEKLGLTAEQKKKMDENLQQYRLKLIDLHASLQKEETILEPLVAAEQPEEAKIVAQIDRVAQARAELEKANARMLLGIRQVLTPEQWKKLREERPAPMRRMGPGQGPGPGPGTGIRRRP